MGVGGASRTRPQASPGRIPHRTIDFLMPKKTHARSQGNCLGCGLFELLRRLIAQRRMQTASIVILLDEGFDVRPQMLKITILVGVDLFPFERFDKALATGVRMSRQLRLMRAV